MPALSALCDDTRSAWGAASPKSQVFFVPISDKDQFLNHWDGGAALSLAGKPHSACLARVKADQTFHMGPSRGWADIGYNVLVCPHGRLIEGRGVLAVGAQCPGYNRSGVGLQYMVGGPDQLTPAMLNRARKFYDALRTMRNEATRMMTHSDGYATSCPGPAITKWTRDGMPYIGGPPPPTPTPPAPKPPAPTKVAPGPHLKFPLPSGYYFGKNDGTRYSVSGSYGRVFNGRTDRSWIQEFASQLTRRGWNIKRYLVSGNDGIFGNEYEALVKAFQADQGLTADGKLGAKTWWVAYERPVS